MSLICAENVLNDINCLLSEVKTSPKIITELNNHISRIDKELSDLDHELELSEKLDATKLACLVSTRRKLLKERRICKDEKEYRAIFCEFNSKNDSLANSLKALAEKLNRLFEQMNNRQYIPRVRTDLTIDTASKEVKSLIQSRMETEKLQKVDQSGLIKKKSKKQLEHEARMNSLFAQISGSK